MPLPQKNNNDLLAAQHFAAWMNVAACVPDTEMDEDDPNAPRYRITGHLVDENVNERDKEEHKEGPNVALINATKAITTAKDGMSAELTKALLAAAATNSSSSVTTDSVKQFLESRKAPEEEQTAFYVQTFGHMPASNVAPEEESEDERDPAEAAPKAVPEASKVDTAVVSALRASAAAASAARAAADAQRKRQQQDAAEAAKKMPRIEAPTADDPSQSSSSKVSFAFGTQAPKRQNKLVQQQPQSEEGLLYLGNLPKGTGEAVIAGECAKHGRITSVYTNAASDNVEFRWALVRYKALNDAFVAVGRLSSRTTLFGSQTVEVRLGSPEDSVRADREIGYVPLRPVEFPPIPAGQPQELAAQVDPARGVHLREEERREPVPSPGGVAHEKPKVASRAQQAQAYADDDDYSYSDEDAGDYRTARNAGRANGQKGKGGRKGKGKVARCQAESEYSYSDDDPNLGRRPQQQPQQRKKSEAPSAGKHSNVFVGSLPQGLTDVSFRKFFQRFGTVLRSKLIADKGYGFIKFSAIVEAAKCVEILNSEGLSGSKVLCRFATMGTRM